MPTDDDVLTWDSSLASNQKWAAATGGSGIPETLLDAKGDLIVASAADTAARLAVGGTDGHVLTVDAAETLGVKWAAPAGGAAEAQVVTATSSLTETDGAIGLLRGGSTPFEFKAFIYDATYGKWVSEPVPLIMQGNTFTDTGTGYTSQITQNSLMIGNILGYRALYDAGARLQFRLKGLLANSGANTTFAQLQGGEFSDGDTAATQVFTVCEISHTTATGTFKVSAWTEPTGWTPADSHMRVVVQTKVSAGTGSYFQLHAEYRWTAAA